MKMDGLSEEVQSWMLMLRPFDRVTVRPVVSPALRIGRMEVIQTRRLRAAVTMSIWAAALSLTFWYSSWSFRNVV